MGGKPTARFRPAHLRWTVRRSIEALRTFPRLAATERFGSGGNSSAAVHTAVRIAPNCHGKTNEAFLIGPQIRIPLGPRSHLRR